MKLFAQPLVFAAAMIFAFSAQNNFGQGTVYWRNTAANGNWANDDGSNINNWYRSTPNGWDVRRGDLGDGQWSATGTKAYNIFIFDNGTQATTTVNAIGGAQHLVYRLLLRNNTDRTFNATDGGNIKLGGGSEDAKIETEAGATGTYTFNVPIELAKTTEISAVNGNMVFNSGSTINTAGNILESHTASGKQVEFKGVISGTSGQFQHKGAGLVILDAVNTYTGATTVEASGGRIQIKNASALGGTGGATTVSAGAAVEILNALGSSIGETLTLSGDGISGGGALRNLTGDNTWSGAISLGSSGVRINSDANTLSLTGGVNLNSNTLYLGGSGNITIDSNLTNAGKNTSDGAVYWNGSGTLRLNQATQSGLTGNIALRSGTVLIGANNALGTGAVTVGAGSAITLASADTAGRSIGNNITMSTSDRLNLGQASTGTGNLTLGGTLAFGATGANHFLNVANSVTTVTINGIVSGASKNLIKEGAGTLVLSANNTFSGGSQINNGTLLVGNNAALGTGTLTFDFAGGTGTRALASASSAAYTLNNNFNLYFNNLTLGQTTGGTGSLTLGGSGKTFNLGSDGTETIRVVTLNGSHTIAGVVEGGANNRLAVAGGGTLTLSGVNTFSGGIQIREGTLRIGHNNALGSGALQVQFDQAGTRTLASSSADARTITNNVNVFNSLTIGQAEGGTGSLTLSGTVYLGDEPNEFRTLTVNGNHTISGAVTGNRGIQKWGAGTLTLSGANTSTGNILIDDGVINLNGGSLGAGTIEIGANVGGETAATLRVSSGSFARNITVNSTGTAGERTIDFANTSGTATLSGNVSIEKDAYVATASGGVGKLSGAITRLGTAGIIKTGAGTLDLGTQTHNVSSIAVQGGTLLLGAANQLGTSTGAASSLNLSAGTTVKTAFDLTSNVLTLAGSSAQADTIFDFNSGSGNDFVFGSTSWSGGNLKLSNVAIGTVVNFGTFTGNAGLTFNDFQSKVSFTDTGLQAQINFSGTSLAVAAIPEPKVYVAAGALALLIGLAEFRRRKKIVSSKV